MQPPKNIAARVLLDEGSDLLDVSRITHGKIELDCEVLQLDDIIARATEIAAPLLKQRQHRFAVNSWPTPIAVEGDAIRLTQVVANLITNAAKYTDPGGAVEISTELLGDRAVLVVSDNGIGIAPDLLTSLFSTFAQEERSCNYSQGGLGLGLSLVKQLVELHNGTVLAHSSGIGCGSSFTVSIPALETTNANGEIEPTDGVTGTKQQCEARRVLIVDDVAGLARITGRLFEVLGHEAIVAETGSAALAEFNTFQPHIVVLDLHLPDMSGFDVAQQIRSRAVADQPVLVALTGSSNLQEEATEAGFDEYLVKPVDINELKGLLRHPKLTYRSQLKT